MATLTRRTVLSMVLSVGVSRWPAVAVEEASALPTEVAGITIPRSRIAVLAAQFARRSCPEYLFNHCMRTFLFGALALRRQGIAYDADEAFTAAALHDLGLLPAFANASQGFEVDGADAAEKFARDNGLNAVDANVIWHGVALHDGRFAITRRAGPEAMLVALGAGSDVDGPDLDTDEEKKQLAAIVTAFPRLQFKKRFTSLLVDHCQRKPKSQRGTWLEGLCREHLPGARTDTIEEEIAAAPFSE